MSLTVERTTDLPTCLSLRRQVFIDEQGVTEAEEVDGLDPTALHLMARLNGQPVGTARILIKGTTGKIGRVCVLAPARGQGIGAALIRAALADLRQHPGLTEARLGAQTHALGFYAALGFTAIGDVYLDAGIPHRDMTCAL
jgi:predicted GNAT family N-acyltransferase